MSYGIDIVAGEVPQSYEEALELRDEVSAAHDELFETVDDLGIEEPSPEMRELHRRLTALFPCICDDSDGPWSDGPLINNFGQQSATLGISFSRVEEVLPFVIATATEMGFWVLDTQDERVHLPGGATIGPAEPEVPVPPRKRWWQFWKSDDLADQPANAEFEEPEDEPEAAEPIGPVRQPIRARVSDALLSRGFRRKGGDHRQDLDDDFSLCVDLGRIGLEQSVTPSVGIRSERVDDTMRELMGVPPDPWGHTVGHNVGYLLGENFRTWYAPADTQEVVAAIIRALDVMRPFASLEGLPGAFALPCKPGVLHRVYALATVALLTKDPARVRQYLAEGQREFCQQDDEVCEQFRDFEKRILARLAEL
jgi:hypothetical protein